MVIELTYDPSSYKKNWIKFEQSIINILATFWFEYFWGLLNIVNYSLFSVNLNTL